MVHMDDDQLYVYSVRIANLLVRTVIEIESISKQLYDQLGGEMVPKDSEGKLRNRYTVTVNRNRGRPVLFYRAV